MPKKLANWTSAFPQQHRRLQRSMGATASQATSGERTHPPTLKRQRGAKSRRRPNPISVRQEEARLKKQFLKDNPLCVVALAILKKKIPSEDHHHTRGKCFPRLRLAVEFWRAVSRWGHDWIERNKDEARKHGWLCQRGEWNTLPKDYGLPKSQPEQP